MSTSELERRLDAPPAARRDVNDLLLRMRPQLERVLPKHLSADRVARIALSEISRTPELLACSQESLLSALMWSAQLGLELGPPLNQAWMLPRRERGAMRVQFLVGYPGWVEIMLRHPDVRSVRAHAVWKGEPWHYEAGLSERIQHEPRGDVERTPQTLVAAYAIVGLANGGQQFVVIWPDDVERARRSSAAGDRGPWGTDYPAMVVKTALLRLVPWAPKSPQLAAAMRADSAIAPDALTSLDEFEPEPASATVERVEPASPPAPAAEQRSTHRSRDAEPERTAGAAAPADETPPPPPEADGSSATSAPAPAVGSDAARVVALVNLFAEHDSRHTFLGSGSTMTASRAESAYERGGVLETHDEGKLRAALIWRVAQRSVALSGEQGTVATIAAGDLRIAAMAGAEDALRRLLDEAVSTWLAAGAGATAWLESVRKGVEERVALACGFRPVGQRSLVGEWVYALDAEPEPAEAAPADEGDEDGVPAGGVEGSAGQSAGRSSGAAIGEPGQEVGLTAGTPEHDVEQAAVALRLRIADALDNLSDRELQRLQDALRRRGLRADVRVLAEEYGEAALDLVALTDRLAAEDAERARTAAEFGSWADAQPMPSEGRTRSLRPVGDDETTERLV